MRDRSIVGPPGTRAAAQAGKSRIEIPRRDIHTDVALFLTVGGWSLFWAQALGIVRILPDWAALLIFLIGIALVPFTRVRPAAEDCSIQRHATNPSVGT
jgi:hypothetical protein